MNYTQTLEYLFSQLPMYQRVGAAAYKANLDNTYAMLDILDNPHNNLRSVHVAGTNGKGSVAHMVASILQEAGYKTGLYTSPHLKDFRERIKINGRMVPEQYVVGFVEKYKAGFESINPSFFEMTVGMAFKYFEDEKVDIAVIETGMGGRLDSTNVITPEIAVITNISFDHMQYLGDTIEKIAAEKSEIIKPGIPVIIGETQPGSDEVFLDKAKAHHASITFADKNFAVESIEEIVHGKIKYRITVNYLSSPYLQDIILPITGYYQFKNLITALQAIETMNSTAFKIFKGHIKSGIENVIENTGILGRWQVLSEKPLTICDIGHNLDGIKMILQQLKSVQYEHLHFVLGMVNDKDSGKILRLLPTNATYYFCKADIPRGLDQDILADKASGSGLTGKAYRSVADAFNNARSHAQTNDLIFIGGSTFVVAEML